MQVRFIQDTGSSACLLVLWFALGCDDDEPKDLTIATPAATGSGQAESIGRDAGDEPASDTPSVPAKAPPLSCGGLLGGSTCDPVTAWPCDVAAGETCDLSNLAGAFRCYREVTAVSFCSECDNEALYCGAGLTCGDFKCERYCCLDSDCERGTCLRGIFGDPGLSGVGFCPEDSAVACGSTAGEQITNLVANSDAGASSP